MEKLQENENERLYFEFEVRSNSVCETFPCIQMLNKSTPPLKPATVAESHENIRKNRFYDILPCALVADCNNISKPLVDENRVILQSGRGNYINASYVKVTAR